ncbi:MAG: hypothetical protein AABW88_03420 [Nanoarchaeota archaeon]
MSNVLAKKILLTFKKLVLSSRAKESSELLKKLHFQKQNILRGIPDKSVARNAVHYISHNIRKGNINTTKADLLHRIDEAIAHVTSSTSQIASIGSKKIKRGMVVYVHGFSESVLSILIKAKNEGINFEVHCTEEKPYMGGRLFATVLAKNKIQVKYYADLAIRQAMKRSDIVLMGANLISESGQIYGRIGSELIADVAERFDVPVYICSDTWKYSKEAASEFDKNKLLRPQREIWSKPPKAVTVLNYGFEKIHPWLVTGIISEIGIYKPHQLIFELKKNNPWMI